MPARPGPRPDQIIQPDGTPAGHILSSTTEGKPAFLPPSALGSTGSTGPTGPQGPPGAGANITDLDLDFGTGEISHHIPLATAIGDGTVAPDAGTAGEIPLQVFVEGEVRGSKLEFTIPDDYASGDIGLLASYRMSTAESGLVLLEADVTIADTINGVVVSSTGPQQLTLNPSDTTDFERKTLLLIDEGSFAPGDVVVVDLKRLGDQPGTDTHGGDWEVAAFMYRYTGQVATRAITQVSEFFLDTDEPAPTQGTLGAIPTTDYSSASDSEQKMSFVVPDNWDQTSDARFIVTYAMGSVEIGSKVCLELGGSIADVSDGSLTAITPSLFIINTLSDDGPHRSSTIFSVAGTDLTPGTVITLKVARRTGGTNDHAGDFKLINVVMFLGQTSSVIGGSGTGGEVRRYILIRDEKPSGTDGGSNTIDTWESRDLNTIVASGGDNVSLGGSGQFTLEAGVYEISASAPANQMGRNRLRLRNITDGLTILEGQNAAISDLLGGFLVTHSYAYLRGRFVITSPKTFEIQHRGDAAGLTNAFGLPSSIGGLVEVYTEVQLYKVENVESGLLTTYDHLATGVFDFISGTVSGDTEAPTVFGDFQTWDILSSTAPGGEIHVSYEGRLNPEQTTITSVDIPIKGTGDYALKVYVEGATTSNPVYDSGIQVAPANRTVLTITDMDLPSQPDGEGRYFVVVEAFVDTGENVRVGLPFVRQD